MLKKTVTTVDFNGVERTEDFYFNLTEAELTEMELSTEGGLYEYLQRIINAKDQAQLIDTFKKIVLKAYGEKSDDGKYFRKSEEICKKFEATQAYSDIYMELVLDDVAASDFIDAILPDVDKLKGKIESRQKVTSPKPKK